MPCTNRRIYPRYYCSAPIAYKYKKEGDYEATMYNISAGGMYFESHHALGKEAHIYVRVINFSSHTYPPGDYNVCIAKVAWCRKIADTGPPVYGVGVKYMVKGRIAYRSDAACSCELCGESMSIRGIHRTDSLYLCSDCFKQLGGLIDGNIKESVVNFISRSMN